MTPERPSDVSGGLDRVRTVWGRMGVAPAPVTITVGGTNGKGSTCAYLERILIEAGYRTGLFTSPHLLKYNERVRTAGEEASDELLVEGFERIDRARQGTKLTYFEFGALTAFNAFAARKVEVAILEVGLGGRLDAVNILDADCSIVVSVDLDHEAYLGDTREKIGFEKACIYRAGCAAIFGDTNPPESLTRHAESIGARLQVLGRDFGFAVGERQWDFHGVAGHRRALPMPALRGTWQLKNAASALAALDAVAEKVPVSLGEVKRGLATVRLAGRLQVLPGRPTIVLDVAHNPHAARSLADGLLEMGYFENTIAVMAMLGDKDIDSVVAAMAPRIDRWFVSTVASERAAPAQRLVQALEAKGLGAATRAFATVELALAEARREAGPNDRICVFGSFYTVAEALRTIK